MSELAGFQRRALRAQAHALKPVLQVGQAGITPAVVNGLREALLGQELLKVRFVAHKEERKQIAADLAVAAGCELVGLVGAVAIYYREHPQADRRRIHLPTR